jgi:signal transduction histidine kinase
MTIKNWLRTHTQGHTILQVCVYVLIFMLMVTFIIGHPQALAGWQYWGTLLALAALLVLNLAWAIPDPNRPRKTITAQNWAFLLLSASLILSMVWMSGDFDAAFLLAVLCMQASFKLGVWPGGVIFAAANLAAWSGLLALMGYPASTVAIVQRSLVPGLFFGLVVMTILERYSRQTKRAEALLQDLQAANAALEAARQKETDLAVAEERVRLARDIHDGLGHHLTVLAIQLQAAEKLVTRSPQAAAEAIQVSRAEAQAALEEVRHSVAVMRQSPAERQPLQEALASLAQSFDRHTGIRTRFTCSGDPREISEFARETLYRAVQEGLTNAQKHAQGVQQVAVHLVYVPGALRLSIQDDGQGPIPPEAPRDPPGFGLAGLRERVARLAGSFRGGPAAAGGFEIEICIPLAGGERDPGTAG